MLHLAKILIKSESNIQLRGSFKIHEFMDI